MKIAVLLTCFNRKEKTLSCLTSLFLVIPNCEVYLVDDSSTDGTKEEIKKNFPLVNIIEGNGNLFWNRGMYLAWIQAMKKEEYNYFLWLNDDVELYPYFFEELLECNKQGRGECIISGLIENEDKTKIIYGGTDIQKRMLQSNGKLQEIVYMNGNVVLVPFIVVSRIGILDPVFHHDLGDVDYGLRAIEARIPVYTTRKAIALGHSNNYCRVRKWNTNVINRLQKLYSPLGSNPRINFYFRKKHFGLVNALIYWIYIHFLNILPDKIVTMVWGDLYCDK